MFLALKINENTCVLGSILTKGKKNSSKIAPSQD